MLSCLGTATLYIYIYIRGHDSDSFNPLYTAPVSRKLYIVTPHLVNWQVPPIRLWTRCINSTHKARGNIWWELWCMKHMPAWCTVAKSWVSSQWLWVYVQAGATRLFFVRFSISLALGPSIHGTVDRLYIVCTKLKEPHYAILDRMQLIFWRVAVTISSLSVVFLCPVAIIHTNHVIQTTIEVGLLLLSIEWCTVETLTLSIGILHLYYKRQAV